jgi:hypothetical protein
MYKAILGDGGWWWSTSNADLLNPAKSKYFSRYAKRYIAKVIGAVNLACINIVGSRGRLLQRRLCTSICMPTLGDM